MEKIVIPQFIEQNYQLRNQQQKYKLKSENQKNNKLGEFFVLIISISFWIGLFFMVLGLL